MEIQKRGMNTVAGGGKQAHNCILCEKLGFEEAHELKPAHKSNYYRSQKRQWPMLDQVGAWDIGLSWLEVCGGGGGDTYTPSAPHIVAGG